MTTVERIAYTPREAAAASGLSLKQIQAAYLSGELTAHYRSPRRPLILRSDLEAWIAAAPTDRATA